MLGYTEEDMKNGLVFKDIVPDIDYESIISELRETFIDQRYACYEHFFKTKTGEKIRVVVFIRIENKLLEACKCRQCFQFKLTGWRKNAGIIRNNPEEY
mgnify:CR=1 FL=1